MNYNLSLIIYNKILKKQSEKNHLSLINHLKIIIDYSKYDICYKYPSKKLNTYNYHNNFYEYYFKYRIRYKKKVDKKFVDYYIKSNNIKL